MNVLVFWLFDQKRNGTSDLVQIGWIFSWIENYVFIIISCRF